MNLSELKSSLGVQVINLNTVVTKDNVKTSWLRDWDNNKRIAILVHADTLAKIKANPTASTLGIVEGSKNGAKGTYTTKTIVMYTPAEETL